MPTTGYQAAIGKSALLLATLALLAFPSGARACAACFGQSDAPLAQGMNWGILSLLAVVLLMWGGIITMVVFLARRGARLAREAAAQQLGEATSKA